MKKIHILMICTFLMAFYIKTQSQSDIDYSQPIESGFFFLDGKYIETPYNFEVIDLAIYINGLQLDKQVKFSQYDQRVFEDPGQPIVSSNNITLYAMDSIRTTDGDLWVSRRIRYYSQNYPPSESYTLIFDFLKSLPFFESVEYHNNINFELELRDKFGNYRLADISPVEVHAPPLLQEIENGLTNKMNRLQKMLYEGECIYYFTNAGEMSVSKIKTAKILLAVLEALEKKELSDEMKKELLEEYGLVKMNNSRNQILIDNYVPNNQAQSRLEELRKQIIEEYGESILMIKKKVEDKENKGVKTDDIFLSPNNDYWFYYHFSG